MTRFDHGGRAAFFLHLFLVASMIHSSVTSPSNPPEGLTILGTGYNILFGNPDVEFNNDQVADGYSRRILDLTSDVTLGSISNQVEYVTFETCSSRFQETIYESTKKYQSKLLEDVEIIDDSRNAFTNFEFSKNERYLQMEHKIENDWHIFYESQTSCSVGKGRYVIEEAKSRPFSLSTEFVTDVCQLPSHDFSSEKYKAFLDKWGTHIVVEVELGYKERQVFYTTREELIQSILADRSLDNIRNEMIEVKQRNSPGERSSVVVDIDRLMESPFKKNHFTNNFEKVVISQNDLKEAISIKVMSIATVLDSTLWQLGNAYLQNGYCTPSHLEDVRVNIAKAMTSYALESDARISKSTTVQLTVYWPAGTYTLPMVENTTCPSSQFYWSMGWRYQETENTFPDNDWSEPCHLQGPYNKRAVKHSYCTKTVAEEEESGWRFPTGSYCIMKYGDSCPTGFQEGWILWDDENTLNSNDRSGILPAGVYDEDTLIYFCCRNDGSTLVSAIFPTDDPFYLFQYSRMCQNVLGMNVIDEFFQWDGDNDIRREKNYAGGMYPRDTGDITGSDHKLHYCYYYPAV